VKKSGIKRKGSIYWREVKQLFTRTGAFGIMNLFNDHTNTNEYTSATGKTIHNETSSQQNEIIKDNIPEFEA
jgi:hypothetical protein